jgi:hydrogenase-4 component E
MMPQALYVQLLDASCGALLITAVLIVWRRQLTAIIRALALHGAALAALAAVLAVHAHDVELAVIAAGVLVLRAGALPALLRRALASAGPSGTGQRETRPVVNVAASLLAAAALVLLAYAVSGPLIALAPSSPAAHAIPVGIAVTLAGFFVLVTRRRALSQLAGFLLMDNGITATGLLTGTGTGLVVELGASLDVLLAVLVLQVLASRMRETFGDTDLDELRELHD